MGLKFFLNLLENRSREIAKFYPMVHSWESFFVDFYKSLPEFSTLLDFGCGDGSYLINLANQHNFAYGVGVDIDGESLKKANNYAKRLCIRERVDFIKGDLQYLPFKKEVFDGVLAKDIFHHLPNFLSVPELSKITKPKGVLLIIDQPMTHPLKFFIRKVVQFVNISSYTYDETFQFFSPDMLEQILNYNDFTMLKKQYAEYFFYFLYLFVLLPECLFRFSISFLLKNVNVLTKMEKRLGVFPGIKKLGAYVYFFARKM